MLDDAGPTLRDDIAHRLDLETQLGWLDARNHTNEDENDRNKHSPQA